MHDARLEAVRAKRTLKGPMVFASAFDRDNDVAEIAFANHAAHPGDGGIERTALVLDGHGRHENVSVEVGNEKPRPLLGDIDGDDAETLRPDGLNAWTELSIGLEDLEHAPRRTRGPNGCRRH